jgi:hypothetical protein
VKYHVISGDVKFCLEAESIEKAFVQSLQTFPLERFSQFLCGYEDGKENDPDASWFGLTEFYLADAGYEEIEPKRWQWRKDPNDKPVAKTKPQNQPITEKPTAATHVMVWLISANLSRVEAINFAKSFPRDDYYLLKTHENPKARHIAKRERYVVCRFPHKDEKIPEGSAREVEMQKLEKLVSAL